MSIVSGKVIKKQLNKAGTAYVILSLMILLVGIVAIAVFMMEYMWVIPVSVELTVSAIIFCYAKKKERQLKEL